MTPADNPELDRVLKEIRTVDDLVQLYCSDELKEDDAATLCRLLESNLAPENPYRNIFVKAVGGNYWTHCLLDSLFHIEKEDSSASKASCPVSVDDPEKKSAWPSLYAPPRKTGRFFKVASASVAVLLVMALFSAHFFSGEERHETVRNVRDAPSPAQPLFPAIHEEPVKSVAMVQSVFAVVWDEKTELQGRKGDILGPGWIRLRSGSLSLVFLCGANVVLDGPVEFRLIDESNAFCASGEVFAEVPQQAIGFQIEVPQAKVVDLGTSFGMKVDPDGTIVHVVKGEVEVSDEGDGQRLLEIGESALVREAGNVKTYLPKVRSSSGPDDDNTSHAINMGDIFRAQHERIDRDSSVVAHFDFAVPGKDRKKRYRAMFVPGRFPEQYSLEFRRKEDAFEFDLPDRFKAMTLVMWARIDALTQKYNTLLSTHGFEPGALHWSLLYDGAFECSIRTGPSPVEIQTFRSKPVMIPWIGCWSQFAMTLDKSKREIEFYLNGISIYRSNELDISIPVEISKGIIGNWTYPAGDLPPHPVRSLSGRVEDLILFNRVLDPEDIRRLYSGEYYPSRKN